MSLHRIINGKSKNVSITKSMCLLCVLDGNGLLKSTLNHSKGWVALTNLPGDKVVKNGPLPYQQGLGIQDEHVPFTLSVEKDIFLEIGQQRSDCILPTLYMNEAERMAIHFTQEIFEKNLLHKVDFEFFGSESSICIVESQSELLTRKIFF